MINVAESTDIIYDFVSIVTGFLAGNESINRIRLTDRLRVASHLTIMRSSIPTTEAQTLQPESLKNSKQQMSKWRKLSEALTTVFGLDSWLVCRELLVPILEQFPSLCVPPLAFDPEKNPLGVPIVQVSLFDSEDADQHYRLGEALQGLRDEGVLIVGAGMAVHNLRDFRAMRGMSTKTMP